MYSLKLIVARFSVYYRDFPNEVAIAPVLVIQRLTLLGDFDG